MPLELLVPHPTEVRTFDSPTEYLKKGDFSRAPGNAEVPREMTQRMDKVAVSRFFVKGEPKPEYLLETARKLMVKLRKKCPQDRFHITTVFEPAGDEGWLKTKKCGVLEVRRLPDHDARAVVTRKVFRETGQKESFLHSAENLLGLFSALDMNDKLALGDFGVTADELAESNAKFPLDCMHLGYPGRKTDMGRLRTVWFGPRPTYAWPSTLASRPHLLTSWGSCPRVD